MTPRFILADADDGKHRYRIAGLIYAGALTMAKRLYTVTIPIGGHAFKTVKADDEKSAIEIACDQLTRDDIEEWDILNPVSRGNVLSFPMPWEIEVTDETPDEASS